MKNVDGYKLIDMIKSSVEQLMNMRVESEYDEEDPHRKPMNSIDQLEVDLPEGAKIGLKNAS